MVFYRSSKTTQAHLLGDYKETMSSLAKCDSAFPTKRSPYEVVLQVDLLRLARGKSLISINSGNILYPPLFFLKTDVSRITQYVDAYFF